MRILVTSTPGSGHFLPLVPFARALQRAGDEVLVAVRAEGAAAARGAGFDVHVLPDPDMAARGAVFARIEDPLSDTAGRLVVGEVYAGLDAPAARPAVEAAIDRFAPDLVLSESTEFAGPMAALDRGLPFVRGSIFLSSSEEWARPWSAGRVPGELHEAPRLTLAPRALDPAEREPAGGLHRFAESVPVARRPELPPLVLLTFGTVTASTPLFPGVYREALAQLAELDVRVLVALGREADPGALGPLPANVRAERWVPLADVLPEAMAVVHHGGFGTTRAAACAGVPAVVVPMFADQGRNAARIDELRAGIAVRGAHEVGAAVQRVLADGAYEVAAKRIRLSAATLPLVGHSVALLHAIAQEGSAGGLSSVA